jgi:hypothetical protein
LDLTGKYLWAYTQFKNKTTSIEGAMFRRKTKWFQRQEMLQKDVSGEL